MSSKWELSDLGREAVNASRAFSFKEHPAVVFVNTGDVLNGKFLHATISDSKGLPGQAKKALKKNDILLTEIRPGNGRYAFVDFDVSNYVVSTKFMVIESLGRVSPRFLYHVLTNQAALDEFQRIAESRSGTFPQITFDSIAHFPIPVPPIPEQEKLVSFLDALDDRITLLRETNATLEAIAKALFKSWFVDFDPVRAKMEGRAPEGMDEATAALFPDSFEESELELVPKGWTIRTMSDISTVGIGKTPPRKEPQWFSENSSDERWVSIRDMGLMGTYASNTAEYLTNEAVDRFNVRRVPDNTVLMSFKLTVGRVAITDGEMTTNEAIAHFKLRSDALVTTEYIYLHLKQFDFSQLSSTSSIADAVNSKTVREIPILVPNPEAIRAFQSNIDGVFGLIKNAEKQAQTLVTLRDTLLPRLISGQLRLTEGVESVAVA